MKKIILSILLFSLCTLVQSQTVGKMDFKADGFTQKKFNNAEKKIFIQHFTVNYQTVMVSYAKAKRGMGHGGAEAGLALGLGGVTDEQLQKMTDRYYDAFVTKLEAAGFSIMTADEVRQNEHFADWEKMPGGTPTMDALATGYLTTTPARFTMLDGGAGAFNLGGHPESKKLGGAIVIRVSITVPFAEAQSTNGGLVGGVAKIVAKNDLRLSPTESIPVKGDFKKPKVLVTNITFGFKRSLKWQALFNGKLKKPLEIENVLDEKKKYKASSVATTGSGFTGRYSQSYAEKAQLIECDPAKYEKGVDEAVNQYLNATLEGFLKYIK